LLLSEPAQRVRVFRDERAHLVTDAVDVLGLRGDLLLGRSLQLEYAQLKPRDLHVLAELPDVVREGSLLSRKLRPPCRAGQPLVSTSGCHQRARPQRQ
jgi:hypothetical protein